MSFLYIISLTDYNFAMHVYKEHMYSCTCGHFNKKLHGEDGIIGIHIKMLALMPTLFLTVSSSP